MCVLVSQLSLDVVHSYRVDTSHCICVYLSITTSTHSFSVVFFFCLRTCSRRHVTPLLIFPLSTVSSLDRLELLVCPICATAVCRWL